MNIQPFHISIADEELADLNERLRRTRWPSSMDDVGWAMGMDQGFLRALIDYWLQEFDWRRIESSLNALPQFSAKTEAGTLYFLHFRSDVRIPRDREQGFHGIVNTDSTAT